MDDTRENSKVMLGSDSVDDNSNANTECIINKEEIEDETNETDSSGSGEVSESEPETRTEDFTSSQKAKFEATNYEPLEEADDRSQTPLQDEIESIQVTDSENLVVKSPCIVDEKKSGPELAVPKDTTLNDDHGELDYEEDEMIEEGHDKVMSEKKAEESRNDSKGSEDLSSDGELADDDDCEEGEIKEPGTKRPFVRPLCRFFTRGNCTWGINCRFLHPGINDKGNYSLIDQQHAFQPIPPPGMVPMLRGPPPSWVHERLGKRMLPPPRPSEISQSEAEGLSATPAGGDGPTSESAWERGLRHAKEIQRKRKDTDNDDKKDKDESSSPPGSPPPGSLPSQLAPPPPRDPYFDDLHRPLPPPMPGRIHPLPMPLHPPLHHIPDAWSYRHPFEYEMRWHRPPPPDFMHHGFPPMHDMRFMERERMPSGRRFSPPLRMDPGRKDERMSRYDRYRGNDVPSGFDASRGKCEEWKDPWLRTKSPKKKHDSSSSRSRSRKRSRSKRSYSSFSSSSYSSKSRSSSSSSYSSSRSSFSSRSRSSSKSSGSLPKKSAPKKMSPFEKSARPGEPLPKSVITKVIPPSLADMTNMSNAKLPSTQQVTSPATNASSTSYPICSTVPGETSRPPMSSLSITIAGKQSGNAGRTSQLQPVGKSVAEAFKDIDEDSENVKIKSRMSKLPQGEFSKPSEIAAISGTVYKSGIVQGNVSYPIPLKTSTDTQKKNAQSTDKLVKRTSRSTSSSRSRSSSSHSRSSSHSGDSGHIYSNIASPISSDSPISPPRSHPERGRGLPQKGADQPMHRPMNNEKEEKRKEIKGNKHFEVKPDRRDMHQNMAELIKMRRDHRPEYVPRSDVKPDQKTMARKPIQMAKVDMIEMKEPRGDGRDYFKGDMRRQMANEQKVDARASNMRRELSREKSRERNRAGLHPHLGRRDERGSHGRTQQDTSLEYRRVVHTGPPSKMDIRHPPPVKRPASPYTQRSPKRPRQIPGEQKDTMKVTVPKVERGGAGRGNTRVNKEGYEEDAKLSLHQASGKMAKVAPKKSTSTKREELLLQLKAVEDAIAKKRSKNQ